MASRCDGSFHQMFQKRCFWNVCHPQSYEAHRPNAECVTWSLQLRRLMYISTARECNVFTSVCLSVSMSNSLWGVTCEFFPWCIGAFYSSIWALWDRSHGTPPPEVNTEVEPPWMDQLGYPLQDGSAGVPPLDAPAGVAPLDGPAGVPPPDGPAGVPPQDRPHIGHTSTGKWAVFLWKKDFYLFTWKF